MSLTQEPTGAAPHAPPPFFKASYYHHRASGRAFVTIDGRRIYLGPHGTQKSRDRYDRVIGEWIARGRTTAPDPATAAPAAGLTVVELIDAYWQHAKAYYVHADGTPTSELATCRDALRVLKRLYGPTPAAEFGPKALRACRESMIGGGGGRRQWSRRNINKQVARIKRLFKWAVSQEMLPPAVFQAVATVDGLRRGRSGARETAPVRPVPLAQVEAVLPFVARPVRAMIQLQLLTGARGGELFVLRACDVDTSGDVWSYRPTQHKGTHREQDRVIRFGPKAKEILEPFLRADVRAFVFSPAEAAAERRGARAEARKTPPGRGNGPGTNRKARPKRVPGERYDTDGYGHAIARACDRAFPPPAGTTDAAELKAWRKAHRFHPHPLRHAAATFIAHAEGIEMARVILGHRHLSTTEIYAEADQRKAEQIMRRIG